MFSDVSDVSCAAYNPMAETSPEARHLLLHLEDPLKQVVAAVKISDSTSKTIVPTAVQI